MNESFEEQFRKVLEQLGINTLNMSPELLKEMISTAKKFTTRCVGCGTTVGTFWNYCSQCGLWLPSHEQETSFEADIRRQGCVVPHDALKKGAKHCHSCGKKL